MAGFKMDGVTVVDHPLVAHKLSIMRAKETSTARFRQLLREISTLLCYEVTRDLPLEPYAVETPVGPTTGQKIEGKKLVFVPILRAGLGLVIASSGVSICTACSGMSRVTS